MGYRKYAKDYEIEYLPRLNSRRPVARRIYIGPYYRFAAAPDVIRRAKRIYLFLLLAEAALLLLPLCLNCPFSRVWYIQLPTAAAWIPWVLAAAAVWRLWTTCEPAEREQRDMLYGRMCGATLCLLILCGLSAAGSVFCLVRQGAEGGDSIVLICAVLATLVGALLFSQRKKLAMVEEPNPEKL